MPIPYAAPQHVKYKISPVLSQKDGKLSGADFTVEDNQGNLTTDRNWAVVYNLPQFINSQVENYRENPQSKCRKPPVRNLVLVTKDNKGFFNLKLFIYRSKQDKNPRYPLQEEPMESGYYLYPVTNNTTMPSDYIPEQHLLENIMNEDKLRRFIPIE